MPRYLHARDPDAPAQLAAPEILLFDWHATLVDTQDAMYRAVDDVLAGIESLGLLPRLVPAAAARTSADAELIDQVRQYRRLPPAVRAARRMSRTDIFEILFGSDEDAKQRAHVAFNERYRGYYGAVQPYAGGERELLVALRRAGIRTGLLSNREREFVLRELAIVEQGRWRELFDVVVCGAEAGRRKPAPDAILKALAELGAAGSAGPVHWYVGDSASDVTAAKRAGITAVFFNGAGWDPKWFETRFPGSGEAPHVPDVMVDDCRQLQTLVAACLAKL